MSLERQPWVLGALVAASLLASEVSAQSVQVANAWARATAPGQTTAGVYLELTSNTNTALVAAGSPVAHRAELHAMSVDGGVMRMRSLPRIDLPAHQTVKLEPNGIHVMLFELKQPLKPGDRVAVVLSLQPSGSSLTTLRVEAEVRPLDAAEVHKH
jgi:copper(I)-binding protein